MTNSATDTTSIFQNKSTKTTHDKCLVCTLLSLYGAMLHLCNILFLTLLLSVVKLISLLCVFVVIFKLLLVHPHFLDYFFFIFARMMVKAARKPEVHTFFVMILYRVTSLYGIHFSNFLNSIHGSLHLYSNFIQTLSHTKTQITKLICCIYATLPHSGYNNVIVLIFFKSVVESFFLNTKYI